jgi:hypothetical protein
MTDDWRYFTVDRIEGTTAVLLGDDRTAFDVPRSTLPKGAGEDSVLRAPLKAGAPDWSRAVLDDAERERRLARSKAALDQLKRHDPGGNLTL